MHLDRKVREEDAVLDNRARSSRHVLRKGANGHFENFHVPRVLVAWQDIGMYNLTVDQLHAVHELVMPSVACIECSRILFCPSPPIIKVVIRHFGEGNERLKQCFQRMLERETMDTVLATFTHSAP